MMANLLRFDKTKRFTFIDYETYNLNLNFRFNKPWQVGLMKVVGDDMVSSRDLYVKWPNPPKFNPVMVWQIFKTSVSDLNARIASKGVTPDEAFDIMYEHLEDCDYIVGHNILGFDLNLAKEWCELRKKPWRHWLEKAIDTNCLAKGIKMSVPFKQTDSRIEYQYRMYHRIERGVKTRLEILGREEGIEHDYEKLHDAIVDLDLNRKVFNKQKQKIEI